MKRRLTCFVGFASLFSLPLGFTDENALQIRNDAIIVRAIERMEGDDYAQNEHVQQAIERHIARQVGTADYIELAARYHPDDMVDRLTEMVTSELDDSIRVRAAELLLSTDEGRKQIRSLLDMDSVDQHHLDRVNQIASALALSGKARGREILGQIASDSERPFETRKHVVMAMSRGDATSKQLLSIAEKQNLPADTRMLAGGLLGRSANPEVRQLAAKLFPQAQRKDRQPLPPIDRLAQMTGNAENGAKLFREAGTCANCHLVSGQGKSVGPDLTEIGSKLSREALLTSILDPSAGISHNFENFVVLTAEGQLFNGLLISKTDDHIVIRTSDAIDRKIGMDDVESIKQSEKSIMPENLHHAFDQQGLIDIIEFMTTLKKN